MPFEDFEGESSGDGSYKTEGGVFAPEYVLVEVRKTIVADCGCEVGEERESPCISCPRDDMVDVF